MKKSIEIYLQEYKKTDISPNPICILCNNNIIMGNILRKNHSYTGSCKECKLMYAIVFTTNEYKIINIQRRFAYGDKKWHATYRPEQDETTFVTVQKQPEPTYEKGCIVLQPKIRDEYKLPTFVSVDRFIKLLAFL